MSNSESEFTQAAWMMLIILTILKTLVLILPCYFYAISATIAATSKNSNYDGMALMCDRLNIPN
jgi:hypothetical protein